MSFLGYISLCNKPRVPGWSTRVIYMAAGEYQSPNSTASDIPSWVPDWRFPISPHSRLANEPGERGRQHQIPTLCMPWKVVCQRPINGQNSCRLVLLGGLYWAGSRTGGKKLCARTVALSHRTDNTLKSINSPLLNVLITWVKLVGLMGSCGGW